MEFKSKIDWWYFLVTFFFGGTVIGLIYLSIIERSIVVIIVTVFLLLLFTFLIIPSLFTYYTLEEKNLYIRCGLSSQRILYSDIISIEETNDPSSSAAPSLDRIGIEYKYNSNRGKNYIMISPKLKQEFIKELLTKNYNIIFKHNH